MYILVSTRGGKKDDLINTGAASQHLELTFDALEGLSQNEWNYQLSISCLLNTDPSEMARIRNSPFYPVCYCYFQQLLLRVFDPSSSTNSQRPFTF